MYPIIIDRPVAGQYNLRDEIDKACKKVVEMGFADPAKDLVTVTAGEHRTRPRTRTTDSTLMMSDSACHQE